MGEGGGGGCRLTRSTAVCQNGRAGVPMTELQDIRSVMNPSCRLQTGFEVDEPSKPSIFSSHSIGKSVNSLCKLELACTSYNVNNFSADIVLSFRHCPATGCSGKMNTRLSSKTNIGHKIAWR